MWNRELGAGGVWSLELCVDSLGCDAHVQHLMVPELYGELNLTLGAVCMQATRADPSLERLTVVPCWSAHSPKAVHWHAGLPMHMEQHLASVAERQCAPSEEMWCAPAVASQSVASAEKWAPAAESRTVASVEKWCAPAAESRSVASAE